MDLTTIVSILPEFILDPASKTLTIKDTTDYAGNAVPVGNLESILRITGPNLLAFHSNAGYPINDFSNPDIDLDVILEKAGILLPLDQATNEVLQGTYKVEYKVKWSNQPFTFAIIAVDTGNDYFYIQGDQAELISDGNTYSVDVGGNAGAYTIIQAVYEPGADRTRIEVNEDVASAVVEGNFIALVDRVYEIIRNYEYCFVAPTVSVDVISNCDTSQLFVTDKTTYDVDNYTITSHDRLTTVEAPTGSNQADVTADQKTFNVGPNIFTGTYTAILCTDVVYTIIDPNNVDDHIIRIPVKGYEEHKVTCSDCLCEVFQCIRQLQDNFIAAIKDSPAEVVKFGQQLTTVNTAWMIIGLAKQCDEQKVIDQQCCIIREIVQLEGDCGCTDESDDGPIEIIPILSPIGVVAGAGSGAQILFNDNPPSDSIGQNGYVFIVTSGASAGDVYSKVNGSWQLQMNINGADGNDGNDGADGANGGVGPAGAAGADGNDGADGALTLFHHDQNLFTHSGAGASLELFKTIVIPANKFANFGDRLIVTIQGEIKTDANPNTIALYGLLVEDVTQHVIGVLGSQVTDVDYRVIVTIYRKNAATLAVETIVSYQPPGVNGYILYNTKTEKAIDLIEEITYNIYANRVDAGVAPITMNLLTMDYISAV